ncbi:MAG: SPFH domain-containing protein [Acidobacteriota bacterium]
MIREKTFVPAPGLAALFGWIALTVALFAGLIWSARQDFEPGIILAVVGLLVHILGYVGLFMVYPNEAKVLMLFGDYRGTVTRPGLAWANPFFQKQKISTRVRNFETDKLKVNDSTGNPIEIGAVVVWKVVDTAEALFEVDDFEHFVRVQSEAALRNLATGYPYDAHEDGEIALASHTAHISDELRTHIDDRLEKAGVDVIEARISHLAYAPEIAAAMLQRQQASAVVAARTQIVEGAVGMVEMALQQLAADDIVDLDEDRRAAMVSNLLVVLCSDRAAHPVVNTGTLHQ